MIMITNKRHTLSLKGIWFLSVLLNTAPNGFSQSSTFTNGAPFRVWADYPEQPSSNMVLRIHQTTNVALPLADWPVVGTFTNVVQGSNYFARTTASLGYEFFVNSASNEWGIVFSSVLSLKPPRGDGRTWLKRE